MSDYELSHGFMVILKNSILKELVSDVGEALERRSNLSVNYEGTLIYSDNGNGPNEGIQFFSKRSWSEFIKELMRMKVEVKPDSAKIYSSFWYNGADSYMSETTLEEFNRK